MNINIYLEDEIGKLLGLQAEKTGKSRNMLIREAIKAWLRQQKSAQWPKEVLSFSGIPEFTPLEMTRDELLPPKESFLE